MEIVTKYDMRITSSDLEGYLSMLKNKVYKLLPLREEGLEWNKHLKTILVELSGFGELIGNKPILISLLSKLESLDKIEDFITYRKTVFECLNLVEEIYE